MQEPEPRRRFQIADSQWRLFFVVLVLGITGLVFFGLIRGDLNDSAALYVGVPIIIALGMSLTPKTKSAVGATMKGLTIALLLAVPVFQEGYICVLMAAPILYGVAAAIAWPLDKDEKKRAEGDNSTNVQAAAITILLALASLEGTHEVLSFERHNVVEVTRIVNAEVAAVRAQLAQTPEFDRARPFFIRIFPLPVSVAGSGLEIGDERNLHFIYNKWFYFNAHAGDTVFRVTEATDQAVRFEIPHDDSYLSHYLTWESSEVLLEPLDQGQTQVTWRLAYQRKLDPIWYFGPMQQYAARLTAETLIDNVADPTH